MDDDSRLAEIVGAWYERRDRGEAADPEEVIRAHPDLADELRARFAALEIVDLALEPAAPADRPECIGPYRLLEELGSGGMGTVYLAEVAEPDLATRLGDRVALKIVHSHLLRTRGFFKRFLREADIGRQVVQENVVRTLDADALQVRDRTVHFLVTEFVEGRTLRELLADLGTVPEALLREIARQLALGLRAIHAQGIVHRDLKPENAIITDDHRVRIMDLGVARPVEPSAVLTREGQFAGSLPYAAPEQFKGGELGPPTDLYALGVVLYELATGRNPFRRDETAAILSAHLELVPPRAADVNPDVSLFFSEVLATLLEKEPDARFESAERLVDLLEEGERSPWWTAREREALEETEPAVRVPVRRETRLIGREDDLRVLTSLHERALAGEGQVVLLEGEAGIGKSRLVDAFLHAVDGESRVLYGSYAPSGGLGGLSEAVVHHFGAGELEQRLQQHLPLAPSLVRSIAALLKHEAVPDDVAAPNAEALHAAFGHLLRSLSKDRPLIWVVEDLHFAGAGSLGLLHSLARVLETERALLLCTTRPGRAEGEIAHFSRLPWFRRTGLGRLSAREVILLLQDAFRSQALAEKLGGRIALQSDGVPFFVFEMIRGLQEGQFITELPDGTFVETREVERIEVPSAVRDLIGARLGDLDKAERALLDAGAVCGFAFDPDLVARALGRSRVAVLQDLSEIQRRSGVVLSAGDEFRFDHHQIHEVLYEGLAPALRKEYHALLAEALADRGGVGAADPGDLPGELAFLLAFHFTRGRDARAAHPFLEGALAHLAKSYRNDALLDLADSALAETGRLEGEPRAKVLLREADCLGILGRRDDQAACLEEALLLAEETGDARLRMQAHSARARHREACGRPREALEDRIAARERARQTGDREGEARESAGIGHDLGTLGQGEEAERELRRGIEQALELGAWDVASAASVNLGLHLVPQARFDEAEALLERGADLGRRAGNRIWEANAYGNLGNLHFHQGRFDRAKACYTRGTALSREAGYRMGEAYGPASLARVSAARGRFEEARAHMEESLAVIRQMGDRHGEVTGRSLLSGFLQSLGLVEEALRQRETALAIAREIGARAEEAKALSGLGTLYLLLGHHPEGEASLGRGLALAREQGLPWTEGACLGDLAALAYRNGEAEKADRLQRDAVETLRGASVPQPLGAALQARGASLHEQGRHDEARPLLEEALGLARRLDAADLIVLSACALAALPGGEVQAAVAAFEEGASRLEHLTRMLARFQLWQLTEDEAHLDASYRLLIHLRDHAPEGHRTTLMENVPLHREIAAAWKARRTAS